MIDKIYNDLELSSLIRELCDENDICVEISDHISDKDYLVLKIDQYYSSKRMHNPPPSVDCIIIVKCYKNNCYDIYLVELKNIKSTKGFKINNIIKKFQTTIDDFMAKQFSHIFLNKDYCVNNFKMYFVSDACRIKNKFPNITESQYRKKILNTKLDMLLTSKPLQFRNKVAPFDPVLPNPMVKPC
ncbi:hypothetical protein MHK_003023 [Candidatus Magnetomorum sp. HK-1]|nr:hypothetical protein MHK_003023 [Candidatus Magnetomorum sp. HK-1]